MLRVCDVFDYFIYLLLILLFWIIVGVKKNKDGVGGRVVNNDGGGEVGVGI